MGQNVLWKVAATPFLAPNYIFFLVEGYISKLYHTINIQSIIYLPQNQGSSNNAGFI